MGIDTRWKGRQRSNVDDGIQALLTQQREILAHSPFCYLTVLSCEFMIRDFTALQVNEANYDPTVRSQPQSRPHKDVVHHSFVRMLAFSGLTRLEIEHPDHVIDLVYGISHQSGRYAELMGRRPHFGLNEITKQ
jgi:hypothetical protein